MTAANRQFGFVLARELMIALGLLALVFISFGHQPFQTGRSVGAYASANGVVYCGSGPNSDTPIRGGHCGACLLAHAADVPLVPSFAPFQYSVVSHIADVLRADNAPVSTSFSPCGSRGPPVV